LLVAPIRSAIVSPARTARTASSSWACRVAEVRQHAIAEELSHVAGVGLDRRGTRLVVGVEERRIGGRRDLLLVCVAPRQTSPG
jgi:hypothetical protein